MEDNPSKQYASNQPGSANRHKRFPVSLGILLLALAHLAFFLPFRALAPVPPEADPWWGLLLVLLDGSVLLVLARRGLTQLMRRRTRQEES